MGQAPWVTGQFGSPSVSACRDCRPSLPQLSKPRSNTQISSHQRPVAIGGICQICLLAKPEQDEGRATALAPETHARLSRLPFPTRASVLVLVNRM